MDSDNRSPRSPKIPADRRESDVEGPKADSLHEDEEQKTEVQPSNTTHPNDSPQSSPKKSAGDRTTSPNPQPASTPIAGGSYNRVLAGAIDSIYPTWETPPLPTWS